MQLADIKRSILSSFNRIKSTFWGNLLD